MLLLEKLAENKIKSAVDRGELENLPGEGKPLSLDDDVHIPADLRAGYRILKNAGYLPAELAVLREIREIEALLVQAELKCDKTTLMTRLSLLKSHLSAN